MFWWNPVFDDFYYLTFKEFCTFVPWCWACIHGCADFLVSSSIWISPAQTLNMSDKQYINIIIPVVNICWVYPPGETQEVSSRRTIHLTRDRVAFSRAATAAAQILKVRGVGLWNEVKKQQIEAGSVLLLCFSPACRGNQFRRRH